MSASGEFHPDLECGEGAELQRQRVGRLQISLRGQDLTLGSQATEAHVSVLADSEWTNWIIIYKVFSVNLGQGGSGASSSRVIC